MSPGYVAATRPLVCPVNCEALQHEFFGNFVPATCCREFKLLNFVGHVAEYDVTLCEGFCNRLLKK